VSWKGRKGWRWGGSSGRGHGSRLGFLRVGKTSLCDNFVKKVISEIRKCRQLQGDFVPLTPLPGALPLDPIGGFAPKPPLCNLAPLAEGLDPPLETDENGRWNMK